MQNVERVLFVHAHPDDESLSTGGTIATLVDRGASVTVLTCTRGEEGAQGADRTAELTAALAALGVTDHRYLGSVDARWPGKPPREYRDSGAGSLPDSLVAAPFGDVSGDIASVVSDLEATVVVSYDEWGGSGHPDHLRAHQAARRAAEVLGVPFFVIEHEAADGAGPVDVTAVLDRKRAAIAAHASQATVTGDTYALADGIARPIATVEYFRRLRPPHATKETFADQPLVTKISVGVLVLALGAVAGLLLTASHQSTVIVGSTVVPWGIIVALLASTGLIVSLRLVSHTRYLSILAAVGILGMSILLASPTRGGSVVIVDNLAGQLWTWVPPFVVLVTLAWPNSHSIRTGKIDGLPAVKGSSIQ